MKIELEINDSVVETVVKGIMDNFPEASAGCALRCIGWKYDDCRFTFEDEEDGKIYTLDKAKLLSTFPLIFSAKWPGGCTKPPTANLDNEEMWNDWLCQCDAIDFDAFAQLTCLGEVIYG